MNLRNLSSIETKIGLARALNLKINKFISLILHFSFLSRKLRVRLFDFGFLFRGNYYSTHEAGLFSIISTVASDCINYGVVPKKISLMFTAHYYKSFFFTDPWKHLFSFPTKYLSATTPINQQIRIHDWWNQNYQSLEYSEVKTFAKNFLVPTSRVTSTINSLCDKYSIDVERTLTVHYRGTDKRSEIDLSGIQDFILRVREELQAHPGLDILILTDDSDAYRDFLDAFPKSKSLVSELPTSEGGLGAHQAQKLDRSEDAINYFASVLIASRSRILVTHTGNGGLWERIIRGTGDSFIQLR